MEVTKIHLSPAEMEMVSDAGIILTKNTIQKKVILLLQGVQEKITLASKDLDPVLSTIPPKISKGENYEGLPYAILDYPRIADKEDLCFIRSMFWWGNFFSSTLHLSGIYRSKLVENFHHVKMMEDYYYIGINDDPWVHHFGPDNYRPLKDLSIQELEDIVSARSFIKIAAKFPLEEWESAATELFNSWKKLAELISKPVK
jgi:hypothetical protein